MKNDTYSQFVSLALEKIDDFGEEPALEKIRAELANHSYEDIVKETAEVRQLQMQIFQLLVFLGYYKGLAQQYNPKAHDIEAAAKILRTLRRWLLLLIQSPNLDDLLSFCMVFGYFGLRVTQLLPNGQAAGSSAVSLADFIVDFLKQQTLNVSLRPGAREAEKNWLERYNEAIRTNKLAEAFKLLDSASDTDSIRLEYELRESLKILLDLDQKKYADFLDAQTFPQEIRSYLEPAYINEKLNLGKDYTFHSSWIYFEIINQCVARGGEEKLTQAQIGMLQVIIEKMAALDPDTFMHAIEHFHFHIDFSKALGGALANIDELLFRRYLNLITMSGIQLPESTRIRSLLLQSLTNGRNVTRVDGYLTEVFQNWDGFLNKNQGIGCIYTSEYESAVIQHLIIAAKTRVDLQHWCSDVLQHLLEIDAHWSDSSLTQSSSFFADLSRLFVYSVVWKEKYGQLVFDEPLHKQLSYFLRDRRWLIRFYNRPLANYDDIRRMALNFGLLIVVY